MRLFLIFCILFLAACDDPSTGPSPTFQPTGKPQFYHQGTTEWKEPHFKTPNRQYGNLSYAFFHRMALSASKTCGLTLDYLYMTYADGYGNRAVFQGKHALEGKAKATIDAWVQKYESVDFSSDAEFCAVMEQNKKDKTLLGALFI
ncbi:MAG: hypothetical protein AAF252_06430 [Pseudomonadota bacterium]